jgi:two-component system response regulator HydG
LFHRLAVLSFHIAPLRHRTADLEVLSDHILSHVADRYHHARMTCTPEAVARLASHDWPGNVRELANALERAVLNCAGSVLTPAALSIASRPQLVRELRPLTPRSRYSFAGTPAEEIGHILAAIAHCRGNKTRAAEMLGMSRNTLLNKLRTLSRTG